MQEDFLHYVWRMQKFDFSNLRLVNGKDLSVLDFGQHNTHSGPDFLNAKIRIEDTIWAGNIEMHLSSSDWLLHKHQDDPAYESVILHVVLENDINIAHPSGETIPCLELKDRISPGLIARYRKLMSLQPWVPCQNQLEYVPEIIKQTWIERMLVERLEEKISRIRDTLTSLNGDWEETAYHILARSFGFKVNGSAFAMLAERLPLKCLLRHRDHLLSLESLCFGCAGFLNRIFTDPYPVLLQREFRHLSEKYQLSPMAEHQWRWLRMRPSNFPAVRISQFANFFHRHPRFLSGILESEPEEIYSMFTLSASEYWNSHVRFDQGSSFRVKHFGKTSMHGIIINTIIPFLFFYGKYNDSELYTKKALKMIHALPPENNSTLRRWTSFNMPNETAGNSQGLIQLKQRYCEGFKCLRCAIGNHVLKKPEGGLHVFDYHGCEFF